MNHVCPTCMEPCTGPADNCPDCRDCKRFAETGSVNPSPPENEATLIRKLIHDEAL